MSFSHATTAIESNSSALTLGGLPMGQGCLKG